MPDHNTTPRRDRLPCLTLEFEGIEDRQQFLNGMIDGITGVPSDPKKPPVWSHLKQWRLGGSR